MLKLLFTTVAREVRAAFFIFLTLGLLNTPTSNASSAAIPNEFRGKWITPNDSNRDIKELICDDDIADKNILTITGSGLMEVGKTFGEIDFLCKIAKVTVDKQYFTSRTIVVKQTCTFYNGAISGARPLSKTATEKWQLSDISGEPFMIRDKNLYRKCR